jgi:hypothetical protein
MLFIGELCTHCHSWQRNFLCTWLVNTNFLPAGLCTHDTGKYNVPKTWGHSAGIGSNCIMDETAIHSFIHSIGICRMRWILAVLRSFIHSSLLYTLPFHPFPPTSLPTSLTSSCHLFHGLPPNLVVSKFIYITFLESLFFSVLSTCPNQHNLFTHNVSVIVGHFTTD